MATPSRISEKQLAANRANAAKSTGPCSAEGKQHSSQNAVKHGLAAANFTVVRLEDQSELKELYDNLVAAYQPINSQELYAIERIALAQHSLRRAARLEAGLFTDSFNQTCRPFGNDYLSEHLETGIDIDLSQAYSFGIAAGLRHITEQANSFSLFRRYQAQAERNYQRALAEFERLKSHRPELSPNEPISPTNTEQNHKVAEPSACDSESTPFLPNRDELRAGLETAGSELPAGALKRTPRRPGD